MKVISPYDVDLAEGRCRWHWDWEKFCIKNVLNALGVRYSFAEGFGFKLQALNERKWNVGWGHPHLRRMSRG